MFLLLSLFMFHYILHYNFILRLLSPALLGPVSCMTGGSDPTKLLGGLTAKKWGRSRPIWSFF